MKIGELARIAVFAALCAVCSWICIPFAVPFTMQTFAVFLACLALGWRGAAVCMAVYIAVGAVGAPVFSGFTGGVGVLLGPTGGYIIGFLFLCFAYGAFERLTKNKIISLVIGLLVLYLFGTAWFTLTYTSGGGLTFATAVVKCVAPFILSDSAKLVLAVIVARRLPQTVARR